MSTPLKSSSNPLKRSRPLLPSMSQNVFVDSQQGPLHIRSPHSDLTMRSPSRKKRKDPNLENRTPERESTRSRGSSRRSATPDVRYEPPPEKFTPPRRVVLQVSSAKSSRTKSSTPVRSSKVSTERKVVVKLERSMSPFPLPSIDLTKPPPPPSPTDDPLLLLETPVTAKPSEDMEDSIIEDIFFDDATSNAGIFDPHQSLRTDVFASDDDEPPEEEVGEAEGEFTGRFKFYKTPVKDDPPSSPTKRRRESWGRPISPHPRKVHHSWGDSDEEDSNHSTLDSHLTQTLNPPQQAGSCVLLPEQGMAMDNEHAAVEDEFILPGVVEVSSSDPRAAARAAAILKLHHSYIIDGMATTKLPYKCESPSGKQDKSTLLGVGPVSDTYITAGHQYRSPSVSYSTLPEVDNDQSGKEWTKACWKTLDTCFTDERFAVAEASGKINSMADVDDILFESIVERFIARCSDTSWDRAMLLRRVQVLSSRQRSGRGAPRSIPAQSSGVMSAESTSVPPMLLAPRYAYLRGELHSAKAAGSPKRLTVAPHKVRTESARPQTRNTVSFPVPQTPEPKLEHQNPPPSGAKMVLSYLGSFLGRYSPKPRSVSSTTSYAPLPAPPMMQHPRRGPISTPVKAPVPKARFPKESVQLTEISPRMAKRFDKLQPAKDTVHLNHIDPPPLVRPRASSNPLLRNGGGSVKDLIKCFEEAGKKDESNVRTDSVTRSLRKTVSVSDLNARSSWKL